MNSLLVFILTPFILLILERENNILFRFGKDIEGKKILIEGETVEID